MAEANAVRPQSSKSAAFSILTWESTGILLLHCMSLLLADFVAEVRCRLFWSVIPSL
jgi:hypothetical protein